MKKESRHSTGQSPEPCMLCGLSSFQRIYQKGGWGYYRCRGCGLVALYPRPSQKDLLESYHMYLPVDSREIQAWSKMIEPVVDCSVDLIRRRVKRAKPRLLDIGCGYGFFLKKIQQAGWQVEGIEVSKPGRDYAGKRLGLKIHADPLEQLGFSNEYFDAVTLFYVIEHVHDPKQMLTEVRRILAPEGILMLRWPHSTPVVKLLGPFSKRCDVFHTPYHLYDFNPRTMHQLLQQAGFQGIETLIGGHTLPQKRFYRWSSVVFGGMAEMIYRATRGKVLLPGVSKTTIAFKNPCAAG